MSRYSLPDMSCGHCRANVESTVRRVDPAAGLTIDLPGRSIELESARQAEVLAALAEEGYPATPAG